jgi:WD40 repeat protein
VFPCTCRIHRCYAHLNIYHHLVLYRTCFLLLWIKLFDCGRSGAIVVSRFSTTQTMVNPFPRELLDFTTCLSLQSDTNFEFVYYAVTCVQFNPTSDNYFITGCIDGLVRIWDVRKCLVVDWANSKEIVTAVCYRPDGKVRSDILVLIRFYQVPSFHSLKNLYLCCWFYSGCSGWDHNRKLPLLRRIR